MTTHWMWSDGHIACMRSVDAIGLRYAADLRLIDCPECYAWSTDTERAALPVRIVNRAGARRPMPRALRDGRTTAAPEARGGESWYSIRAATTRGGSADVYIYDEIGYWGVSAQRFIDELRDLDAETVNLHVNSPGGEVYDGIAIYNAILSHPATFVGTVDALAASAASFIVQACNEVIMAASSEMMIHDAVGLAWDNAAGLREMADRLDKVSDNIAEIYADRAGGTVTSWRKTMQAETWYSAREAVEAGLADRVIKVERRDGEDADRTEARWTDRQDAISARFRYANRGQTVPPPPDASMVERGWQFPISITSPIEAHEHLVPAHQVPTIGADVFSAALTDALGPPAEPGFVAPDTFHALLDDVAHTAPAPPTTSPVGGALTRAVPIGGYPAALQDLLGEAVTG